MDGPGPFPKTVLTMRFKPATSRGKESMKRQVIKVRGVDQGRAENLVCMQKALGSILAGKGSYLPVPLPGQEGESCLRTSDCAPGFCCARHFWAKICKPVLAEGQVCSRRGQKDGAQGPEIFQRCDCGPGLMCQMLPHRSRLRVCQRN